MPDSMPDRLLRPNEDRRRTPRFGCSGPANIVCLPADGGLLRGTIRNLSVGGCFIETGLLLPCGAQTEILARVHTSSFRALGQVRAVLGQAGICIEFVRLSAGGEYLLTELVKNLAKLRTVPFAMGLGKLPDQPADSGAVTFPVLGTVLPCQPSEGSSLVLSPRATIIDAAPLVDPVDLFV